MQLGLAFLIVQANLKRCNDGPLLCIDGKESEWLWRGLDRDNAARLIENRQPSRSGTYVRADVDNGVDVLDIGHKGIGMTLQDALGDVLARPTIKDHQRPRAACGKVDQELESFHVGSLLPYAFDAPASAVVSSAHEPLWSSVIAASMMRWRELGPRRSSVIELNLSSTACASMPLREKPGGSSTSAT